MGQERRHYLAGHKVYGCKSCRTHLSTSENLMSKVRSRPSPPNLPSLEYLADSA